jgi:uracil-DNA glycosylase
MVYTARMSPLRKATGRASRPAPRRGFASVAAVQRAVIACERCPRLRVYCEGVARVKKRAFMDQTYWGKPVPGFGDPRARLIVIGLAPAAHGGNRTGRVFTGDSSGSWLYEALHRYTFARLPDSTGRDDGQELWGCYVTASARCAPPANKPTPRELDNCRPFLEAELGLLRDVTVVLALGHVAFGSYLKASGWWTKIPPRDRPRFSHGGRATLPDGTVLLTSYHPSRQNTNTGKLTRAMWHAIFARAREAVDRSERSRSEKKTGGR